MSAADDKVVLNLLRALDPPLNVYDSYVTDSNPDAKVISATLPYVVFYGFSDDDEPGDSLAGTSGAHLTSFQLNGVGGTREQARLALERAAAALNRKRVTFASGSRFVRRGSDAMTVRRDDTWTRPDGKPLFYGVDRYSVLI